MDVLEAVFLGLVQGAGEFLPVSSSGHLLLLEKLGVGEEDLFFNICLHLGTLLSVLVVMRRSILALFRKGNGRALLMLAAACLPTVALALLFKYLAPSLIDGAYLPLGFAVTSFLIILSEKFSPAETRCLSLKNSLMTGVFQGVAVLPGISRSGATIAALRLSGVERSEAAEFSFLLSLPVIIGSALYEGTELAVTGELASVAVLPLLAGALAAFLSGCVAIRFFLSHSSRGASRYASSSLWCANAPPSPSPSTPPPSPSYLFSFCKARAPSYARQTTTGALPLHPARGIMPLDPVILYNNYAPKVTASPVTLGAFIEKHGADTSKSEQGENERAWRWFRKKAERSEHPCIFTTRFGGSPQSTTAQRGHFVGYFRVPAERIFGGVNSGSPQSTATQ